MQGRVGFGFIGYPDFSPALNSALTLLVPTLGLQDPIDFPSEEEPLAALGLLRLSPPCGSHLTVAY